MSTEYAHLMKVKSAYRECVTALENDGVEMTPKFLQEIWDFLHQRLLVQVIEKCTASGAGEKVRQARKKK